MKDRSISQQQLHSSDEHEQALMAQMNHFRKTAFLAVAFSTVAVLACVVGLPLAYTYVQRVHSNMLNEMDYCRSRNRDLWSEVHTVALAKGDPARAARVSRQTPQPGHFLFGRFFQNNGYSEQAAPAGGYGQQQPAGYGQVQQPPPQNGYPAQNPYDQPTAPIDGGSTSQQTCCTCQVGPAGPPGDNGPDGKNGADGQPGVDGPQGKDLPGDNGGVPQSCTRECPVGPPGDRGAPGDKGRDGPNGSNGQPGMNGNPGRDGSPGRRGPGGSRGRPGGKGPRGDPGTQRPSPGPAGPAGRPGSAGGPGDRGSPGRDGSPGRKGPKGPNGDAGNPGRGGGRGGPGNPGSPGQPGAPGPCDDCQPPRTPPGY